MRSIAGVTPFLCAAIAFCQTPPCTIQTVAGPASLYSGDGGPAISADFNGITGIRFDQSGNLFIADTNNQRVRKVTPDGIVTTIAGTGTAGFSGDGGLATSAQLYLPVAVSPDNQGNVYIVDGDNRIRKIDSSGIITTYAGTGVANFSGDGGQATAAELQAPLDVLADNAGNVYIADSGNLRVRKINPQGVISTVAGSGVVEPPYTNSVAPPGLGGPATLYALVNPANLAIDSDGNLYICESSLLGMVLQVNGAGVITNYAAALPDVEPQSIAIDSDGNLAIGSGSFAPGVFELSPSGGVSQLTTSASSAYGIAFNQTTLYYTGGNMVTSVISNTVLAGANEFVDTGDGGPATAAQFNFPGAIAVDAAGDIYVVDSPAYQVRKISPNGIITHVAGTSTGQAASGDGGLAAQAGIGYTFGIALDGAGNIYLSDEAGLVRKINTQGIISTLIPANSGFLFPGQLAVDRSGDIYASSVGGVYEFNGQGEILNLGNPIKTLSAASAWTFDPSGNMYWVTGNTLSKLSIGGATTTLTLPQLPNETSSVRGMTADGSGNVYLWNQTGFANSASIQEVTPGGQIFTLGRENPALPHTTGQPGKVDLGYAEWVVSDPSGNLYYADTSVSTVRELTAGCPVVTQPLIAYQGVANAASYDTELAPGELAAVFGNNLGPSEGQVVPLSNGQFPWQYGGVAITVNGYPAPLLYVSQTQTNFVVPFETSGQQSREVQVTYNGVVSDIYHASSAPADLGIFAIANADSSTNSSANPAKAGSYVVIYGTGQGVSNPPEMDGVIMGGNLTTPLLPVIAYLDGQPATVLYAGSAPGLVAGVLQINLQLPSDIAPGKHYINIVSQGWDSLQYASQTSMLFTQ
jgi:uncharacterized protein (TIGR03437 family)